MLNYYTNYIIEKHDFFGIGVYTIFRSFLQRFQNYVNFYFKYSHTFIFNCPALFPEYTIKECIFFLENSLGKSLLNLLLFQPCYEFRKKSLKILITKFNL